MAKEPRPLAQMQHRAAELVATLDPFCERIAVAGSVRRCKEEVADIELVAIARLEPAGLFGTERTSALYQALKAQEVTFLKGDDPHGRYHQLQLDDGLQVDLFLAQEDNWGWIYLLRTGSADFSQAVLTRWKRLQGIGPEGQGSRNGRLVYRDGTRVATPEEQTVFDLVHVPWIAPERRTDGTVLRETR